MTGSGVRIPLAAPLPFRRRSPLSVLSMQGTENSALSRHSARSCSLPFVDSRKNCGSSGGARVEGDSEKTTLRRRGHGGRQKPGARLVDLSDGGGLQLWLTPTGGKLWNYAYRFNGKRKRLAIGSYGKDPAGVPLEAARKRRDEAAGLVRDGVDPATRKRQVKAARAEAHANTFTVVADELLAKKKREGVADATAGKLEWLLGLAKTNLGTLPIADISAGEVLRVLQPLEAADKLETAKRLRAVIGSVFRYAHRYRPGRENDPTQALRGAIASPKLQHRAAITDPTAFGGLLRAIEGFMGQPTTKAALQLMALLACRPGELRHASWAEFDLDDREWEIPEERTKMRRPHRIPQPEASGGYPESAASYHGTWCSRTCVFRVC